MASGQTNGSFINTDQEESASNSHSHGEAELPSVRFTNNTSEHNKRPVQLISIKPIVEDDPSERNQNNISNVGETSRQTGLSKYNWKNFLPVAPR